MSLQKCWVRKNETLQNTPAYPRWSDSSFFATSEPLPDYVFFLNPFSGIVIISLFSFFLSSISSVSADGLAGAIHV